MAEGAYWGYWKHKIESMWKEIDDLKRRVDALESGGRRNSSVQEVPERIALVPVNVREDSRVVPPLPVAKIAPPATEIKQGAGYEDKIVSVLKSAGPLNIVDINSALVAGGIDESVRDTLFNRVKPLMKKGTVEYDEGTQKFFVR
jgi:hypothetical protein